MVVEVKAEWALAGCKTTITFNGVCKGSDYIRIFGIGSIVKGTTLKCSSRVMGTFLMTEGNKLSCTVSRGGENDDLSSICCHSLPYILKQMSIIITDI